MAVKKLVIIIRGLSSHCIISGNLSTGTLGLLKSNNTTVHSSEAAHKAATQEREHVSLFIYICLRNPNTAPEASWAPVASHLTPFRFMFTPSTPAASVTCC